VIETFLAWQWRDSDLLWLLLLPFVWGVLAFSWRRHRNNLYAQDHLLPWVKVPNMDAKKALKTTRPGRFFGRFVQPKGLIMLAWMAMVIALAGPRTLVPSPEQISRSGVDILVAMDASRSMMAQDVAPNRFLHAKALIESLVNRLEANDRVGLMVYAGRPHLVAPLSYDRELFQYYLNLVRPGILPTLGSQADDAIAFGLSHLQQTAGKTQILLLFTDGGQPSNIANNQSSPLKVKKVFPGQLRVIGVGQPQPTVIPSQAHPTGALHVNGRKVMTQLASDSLEKLAEQWQGRTLIAGESLAFLEGFLKDISAQAQARSEQSSKPIWKDHHKPFIALAFFALLWAFYPLNFLGNRRNKKSQQPLLMGVMGVSFFFVMGGSDPVRAQWMQQTSVKQEQRAYDAFQSQRYDEAEQTYQDLSYFNGILGAGASAYRKQDYESAVVYFQQAAMQAESDQKRAYALFNLGNTFYKAGLFAHAIESYQQALLYKPNYEKAKHNLDLAQKARQRQSGQQQNQQQGEGQGRGKNSRDNEGAFYGGQKPDPGAGEGASGDSPEGEMEGKEFVLPEAEDPTDFTLKSPQSFALNSSANAILDQQQRRKRIEQFDKNMQAIQDNQLALLKHLFEREEGFQARQMESHPLPGVQPW